MKKTISAIAVAAIVIVLAATVSQTVFSGESEETVKIGFIGPVTGQAAVLGMDAATAAEIAVEEINEAGGINGKRVELIIEDDQYSTKKAIDAYEKLVKVDKAKIIVIQTYGAVFALAERAKRDNVILFDSLDCNEKLAGLGNHVFCLGVKSESIGELLAGHANRGGFRKVGVMFFNSDTFMPYVKDVFVEEFEGASVAEGHAAGETDFRTSLEKMKERKVEALVLLGYDESGLIMKQSRELGMETEFLMPGTVTSPSLQEAAQGLAEGTIFTFYNAAKEREPAKGFVSRFAEAKGRTPILDLATFPTFDAVKAIAAAVEKAGSQETGRVKEALVGLELEGTTGRVKFEENGASPIPKKLHMLREGRPVLLE